MFDHIKSWRVIQKNEAGQDLAEYAILLGLIALIVIIAITLVGTNMSTAFSTLASFTTGLVD